MATKPKKVTALEFWELCAQDAVTTEVEGVDFEIEKWEMEDGDDLICLKNCSGHIILMTDMSGVRILSDYAHQLFLEGQKPIFVRFQFVHQPSAWCFHYIRPGESDFQLLSWGFLKTP